MTIKVTIDGKEKEVEVLYECGEMHDPHWDGLDLTNDVIPDENHRTNQPT